MCNLQEQLNETMRKLVPNVIITSEGGLKFPDLNEVVTLRKIRLAPLDDFFYWFDKEAAKYETLNGAFMWSHIYTDSWQKLENSIRLYAAVSKKIFPDFSPL